MAPFAPETAPLHPKEPSLAALPNVNSTERGDVETTEPATTAAKTSKCPFSALMPQPETSASSPFQSPSSTTTEPASQGAANATSSKGACPFASSLAEPGVTSAPLLGVSASETDAGKSDGDSGAFNTKRASMLDAGDPFALIKSLFPIQVLVGIGVLIAALLPTTLALTLSSALLLPFFLTTFLRARGFLPNPEARLVRRGAMTAKIEGEFCVFLLGARWNAPWKLSSGFKSVGEHFNAMIRELEALPTSAGYLGGDSYVSSADPSSGVGSHVMAVTYWRSYEHLLRYSHDASLAHSAAVRALSRKLKSGELPDMGLWHEAYVVKPGGHESLYYNCPPLGLGNATGSLIPATGKLSTSKGRVRASGENRDNSSVATANGTAVKSLQ